MCDQHGIKCYDGVTDCVELPGTCMSDTGRCRYEFKPDDTACDDGNSYTVGDQCRKGRPDEVVSLTILQRTRTGTIRIAQVDVEDILCTASISSHIFISCQANEAVQKWSTRPHSGGDFVV